MKRVRPKNGGDRKGESQDKYENEDNHEKQDKMEETGGVYF